MDPDAGLNIDDAHDGEMESPGRFTDEEMRRAIDKSFNEVKVPVQINVAHILKMSR